MSTIQPRSPARLKHYLQVYTQYPEDFPLQYYVDNNYTLKGLYEHRWALANGTRALKVAQYIEKSAFAFEPYLAKFGQYLVKDILAM